MLLASMSAETSTPAVIAAETPPPVTPMLDSRESEVEADGATPDSSEAEPQARDAAAPPPELSESEIEREIAALLFASPDPLSVSRLSSLLSGIATADVERALGALNARLSSSGLPYELRAIAGGWQIFTTADMADTIGGLQKIRRDEKVSPAALETLAVVAYRQPVTKAEIEAIRGVQVGPILRTLVDRGLVRVAGRSDDPGHALLYGTTKKFLDAFALASLADLPRDGELLRD
jgi:segregation and condensation protein B